MATRNGAPKLSDLLGDEALERKGLNVTELARQLLPVTHTEKQLEGKRRLIQKWREMKVHPGPAHARKLAAILGGQPSDYRAPRKSEADWRAQIERDLEEVRGLAADVHAVLFSKGKDGRPVNRLEELAARVREIVVEDTPATPAIEQTPPRAQSKRRGKNG